MLKGNIVENNFFDFKDGNVYPIILDIVNNSTKMKLFVDNINKYHSYKTFKNSPSRNLRFNIYESTTGNNIGSIGLSSAVIAIKCRDDYIGWNKELRNKNLGNIANNSRFVLIKDRITIKNTGSMSLKRLEIDGIEFWKKRYNQDLLLLETFIEPAENRAGAVYKASNWIEVGVTSGNSIRKAPLSSWKKETGIRGELARTNPKAAMEKYGYADGKEYIIGKSKPKIMFIKPLVKDWKKRLLKNWAE
jgi:hypothetical protein